MKLTHEDHDMDMDAKKAVDDAFRWPVRIVVGAAVVLMIVATLVLQGCATKTYTSPEGASITSTTFIYGPELTGMKAVDGNRTLEIQGQKSDLTNALQVIDKLTGMLITIGTPVGAAGMVTP